MKRILKNHIIESEITSIGDLANVLATNKSVYFAPMDRVVPAKFFLSRTWLESEKILIHVANGSFSKVFPREEIMRRKIKKLLELCQI